MRPSKPDLMNRYIFAALALPALLLAAAPGFALTAEEVLASADTPEGKGLAIAKEADRRDFGFDDSTVTLKMVLRNAQGDESTREMRNMTFEMKDMDVGDKTMIVFDHPRDVKGTAFLTYSKILEPDDQWLYLPALKRVKRISSKNKSGPFMGSEFAYEDISSEEVAKYDYKYLRTEPCPKNEELTCFVGERYPRYEFSGYTKMVGWMDTEHFRPMKTVFYDRKEAKLKTLTFHDYKQYLDQYWRPGKMSMVNHQTGKSTDLIYNDYEFRTGLEEDDFTTANLRRMK